MDTPNLLVAAIVVVAFIVAPCVLLQSVGRTGDGMAQLFVPPDRTLGWPRGVQESDEPWAWRKPVAAPTPEIADLTVAPQLGASTDLAALEDVEPTSLVVAVHRVDPRRR